MVSVIRANLSCSALILLVTQEVSAVCIEYVSNKAGFDKLFLF